jgi:hypothetical protein
MNNLKQILRRNFSLDQKGATLILVLMLLALGSIMIVPLLSFMASGFKTTDQVYDRKAYELYAADAGVRDAMWNLKYNPFAIPQASSDPSFAPSSSIILNNNNVNYSISFIKKYTDSNGGLFRTYEVDSIATGPDAKNTLISSYMVQPFGVNNMVFNDAIASGAGMDFKKDCGVVDGPIAYKSGPKPNDGYVFYDPNGDGIDETLPAADPNLTFPSDVQNQLFANGHKGLAQKGKMQGADYTFSGASLGPLYVNGNLAIDSDVPITLNGDVYVTGSIHFTKELVLSGHGTIIAEGDIDFEKGSTLDSSDPDSAVIFMSLNGSFYLKKEQGVYNGLFYAPNGTISLKKGQQIQGSLIAGDGFSTDKELSIKYVAFPQERILPGYIGLTPQIQTWDIGTGMAIGINPSTLPSCKVNTTYPDQTLIAFGGTAPYSWSVSSGSLPNGLTLGSTGILSGTPMTIGAFDFTLTATDTTGKTGSQAFSIVISSLDIITSSPLADGQVGNAYNQNFNATGGTPSYTWSIISGVLPANITLNPSSGVISGTPTSAGNSVFTLKVTDSASPTQAVSSKIFSVTIQPATLSITTTTAANGVVNSSYSQTLSATGGTTPYSWSITSGYLPAGLNLSSGGTISGAPTVIGTSTFTVQVTDSASPANSATRSFSIIINAATVLTVTTNSPLAGGTVGSSYNQTLSATGGTAPYSWSIASGSLPAGLNPSSGGTISGTPTAAGTSNFTVRVTDSVSNTTTKSFSISINNPVPALSSISPTSGSRGSTLNVVLTGTNFISGVSAVNVGTTYITVNSTTVNNSTRITINITLAGGGNAKGTYNFSVTNSGPGGGISGTQQFTITN